MQKELQIGIKEGKDKYKQKVEENFQKHEVQRQLLKVHAQKVAGLKKLS